MSDYHIDIRSLLKCGTEGGQTFELRWEKLQDTCFTAWFVVGNRARGDVGLMLKCGIFNVDSSRHCLTTALPILSTLSRNVITYLPTSICMQAAISKQPGLLCCNFPSSQGEVQPVLVYWKCCDGKETLNSTCIHQNSPSHATDKEWVHRNIYKAAGLNNFRLTCKCLRKKKSA